MLRSKTQSPLRPTSSGPTPANGGLLITKHGRDINSKMTLDEQYNKNATLAKIQVPLLSITKHQRKMRLMPTHKGEFAMENAEVKMADATVLRKKQASRQKGNTGFTKLVVAIMAMQLFLDFFLAMPLCLVSLMGSQFK